MAGPGLERLQEQIRAKVAMTVLRDLSDPRLGMVTIIKVRLTADLEHVKVYWSTLDEGPKRRRTEDALRSARGFVQREVASMLRTRKAPHLEFVFDPSVEGAARVTQLIDDATQQDAARRSASGDEAPEGDAAPQDPDEPPRAP
ncbi:MAG TPA: 30S ribosome-binding factor RbfA [Planctomycetota bacterium]|nr:30S ribosome-binding factor RbfA [Planctomycetota bacterium]